MITRLVLMASLVTCFAHTTAGAAPYSEFLSQPDAPLNLDLYNSGFLEAFSKEYPVACGPVAADGSCPVLQVADPVTGAEAVFFGIDMDGAGLVMGRMEAQKAPDLGPSCTRRISGPSGFEARIVGELSLKGWESGLAAPDELLASLQQMSANVFGTDPVSCSAAVPRASLGDDLHLIDIVGIKDGQISGQRQTFAFMNGERTGEQKIKSIVIWMEEQMAAAQMAEVDEPEDPTSDAPATPSQAHDGEVLNSLHGVALDMDILEAKAVLEQQGFEANWSVSPRLGPDLPYFFVAVVATKGKVLIGTYAFARLDDESLYTPKKSRYSREEEVRPEDLTMFETLQVSRIEEFDEARSKKALSELLLERIGLNAPNCSSKNEATFAMDADWAHMPAERYTPRNCSDGVPVSHLRSSDLPHLIRALETGDIPPQRIAIEMFGNDAERIQKYAIYLMNYEALRTFQEDIDAHLARLAAEEVEQGLPDF